MQLNNLKLLQALGGTIPDKAAAVNKYDCPLHKDGGQSLRIGAGRPGGLPYFSCTNPSCRFFGDAVSLVCAVMKVGPADVIAMLRPGGRLAHVMEEPMKPYEADEYLEGLVVQAEMRAYMSKCRQALRDDPSKCGIRAGVSRNSLRMIPPELGLLDDPASAPAVFRKFGRQKYARTTYVSYPFTFNDEVTNVKVQDADDPRGGLETVVVSRADVGVFMERFDEVPADLVATFDPRDATLIYGNCMAETSKKPPIVAVAGFPLPESLAGVKRIYMLSTPSNPLPLDRCFDLMGRDEIVSCVPANKQPDVRVWQCQVDADETTADRVRGRIAENNHRHTPIELWAIMEIDRLMVEGKTDQVATALSEADMSEATRRLLLATARTHKAGKALIDLLMATMPVSASTLALGNGKTFRRGPTYIKATKGASASVLCNVGIDVLHKIRTYAGDEIVVCNVTPDDPSIPVLRMNIPIGAWSTATSLQAAISAGFSARGYSPYIAFYSVSGYGWPDVLSKLSEKCPLHMEVQSLGIDEFGDLHMPNFVIRERGAVEKQNQIFTMPQSAMQAYSGIPYSEGLSALAPFKRLLERCDNLYVAAFTAGLMHVVYQMTYPIYQPKSARQQAMRHMLYVETEPGIWQSVFRQLSTFFSGSDFVPSLNYADPLSTLKGYSQLGSLPLVAGVPGMRGDKLARALGDSGVCLIGETDGMTATLASGHISATYITPSDDSAVKDYMIAQDDIEALREGFSGFMASYIAGTKIDAAYRSIRTPACAAYDSACALLGVAPQPVFRRIVKSCFPSIGMTGVNTFFDALHALNIRAAESGTGADGVCIVHGRPNVSEFSFTDRGQHVLLMEDVVVVSHAIVPMLNRNSLNRFSVEQLTREMGERGLTCECPEWLGIDASRCWILSRQTWDSEVIRPVAPAGFGTDKSKLIQLSIRIPAGEANDVGSDEPVGSTGQAKSSSSATDGDK